MFGKRIIKTAFKLCRWCGSLLSGRSPVKEGGGGEEKDSGFRESAGHKPCGPTKEIRATEGTASVLPWRRCLRVRLRRQEASFC